MGMGVSTVHPLNLPGSQHSTQDHLVKRYAFNRGRDKSRHDYISFICKDSCEWLEGGRNRSYWNFIPLLTPVCGLFMHGESGAIMEVEDLFSSIHHWHWYASLSLVVIGRGQVLQPPGENEVQPRDFGGPPPG